MGQTLSKKGLWEMGVGFFKGTPQPWAQRPAVAPLPATPGRRSLGSPWLWTSSPGKAISTKRGGAGLPAGGPAGRGSLVGSEGRTFLYGR